jgi:hypothetical protein
VTAGADLRQAEVTRVIQKQVFLEDRDCPRLMLKNQAFAVAVRDGFWKGTVSMSVTAVLQQRSLSR